MAEGKAPKAAAERKPRAKKRKKAPARKGAGRPEFEPNAEQRERVEILVGGGMGKEEIAAALNLSPKTLKKHFKTELTIGRSKKRAEVLEAMFKSASGGNVSAQKTYIALNTIATADAAWTDPQAPEAGTSAPRPEKLGKKELAAAAASTAGAGTTWNNDLETPPLPGAKPN